VAVLFLGGGPMEGKRLQSRGRNFAGAATVHSTGPTLEGSLRCWSGNIQYCLTGSLGVTTEVRSHE